MTPADESAFPALARKISAGVGLPLDAYKDKCIRRRIAVRMRACGVETYTEYGAVLDRLPAELDRLKDALTVNVTRFYRNADTWHALRDSVIPELGARERVALRVWSAGCSSGEEAYTVAMLFAEYFDAQGRGDRLSRLTVDGTDVDRASLERAAAATYRQEALAEMPAHYVARYFVEADGQRVVHPRIRQQVRIHPHDLSQSPPPGRDYHVILCRNVLIYFDREMQEQLFRRFADALVPGGYLVLGKVETLFGEVRDRLTVVDARERIFRRVA